MLKLSLRDIRTHIGRYVLTFLAVAIGVTFMGGVLTLTDTIRQTFLDLISDVNEGTDAAVQGQRQFETGPEFGDAQVRPHIDVGYLEIVEQAEGVAVADAWVDGYTRVIDPEGEPYGNPSFGPPTFGGSWGAVEELNPFNLTEGSEAPDGPGEIVLDKATAEGAGYEIGDTAQYQTVQGSGEATVVGLARFGTADSPLGASFVFFDLETAQEQLAEPGTVNSISVVAEPGFTQQEVRDNIAAELEATLPAEELDRLEVITGEELVAQEEATADSQFSFIRTALLVFAAIAVVVGMFVIYTSFSFIVAQRQRQVALLRAVGASRRQTLVAVLLEALAIGIVASSIGYLIGLALASVLANLFVEGSTSLVIRPGSLAIALITGTLVTAVSAFAPAWRASRVPPIAALRDVAIDRSGNSVIRFIIGMLLLAGGVAALVAGLGGGGIELTGAGAAFTFFGLHVLGPLAAQPAVRVIGRPLPILRGIVGRVAQRNAERNPKRTAYTGSALMIGLGVVSLTLVMYASISASIDDLVDNRFVGDFVVDSGAGFSGAGLPVSVAEEINALPEVNAASGVSFAPAEVEGSATGVGGMDPDVGFDLFDVGVTAGDIADLDADGIGVFKGTAEDKDLQLGDDVEVVFGETGPQTFTVAVLLETKDLTGTYLLSDEAFDENFPTAGDYQVWVQLAEGVSPEEAEPALTATIADLPTAELMDLDEFKDMTKQQLQPILLMLFVLVFLTIVIALIGIVNTLFLATLERSREIGLTRAIGALRSQIRASIRWEALLIGAFGTIAALGTGVFFGWAIVQALEEEGFSTFEIPIAYLAGLTLIAGILSLIAALIPAVYASRRDILPAIATE